jgi:Family of unknown function (DUF5709)
MRKEDFPTPVSDPEAEGLPGTADDDSTAYDGVDSPRVADGPSPAALPSDDPVAVDKVGTTPQEQLHGQRLDERLAEEEPDVWAEPEALAQDEDEPGEAVLPPDLPPDYDPHSPVSLYDRPDLFGSTGGRPVGRLVEPDEGAHTDDEPDAVAYDAGAAGGGATAEELAIHEVLPPP